MPPKKNSKLEIKIISNKKAELFDNTIDNIISITESKAKLIYNDHINNTPNIGLFFTALGFFVSFLLAILTAEFKDFLGLKSYLIHTIFVLITVACFIWCIVLLVKYIKNKNKYNVDQFIKALKNEEDEQN